MQYTVNKLEKGRVEVKVDVPSAVFEKAHEEVLAKFIKETNVSGFRPGKAPADIVEGQVGANKILNQAASSLISKHLSEIFEKENLVPLDSPKIAIDSLSRGLPFSFTAIFSKRPEVKVGDWRKIKIKKIAIKQIAEADVTESIKNIYEAWVKSKSSNAKGPASPAKRGEQTTKAKEEEGRNVIYDARGNPIQSKDNSNPSTSTGDKIDDNFAKAIGARDLVHLKEIVKKDLESIVSGQVEAKFEQEIFEKLREISEFEVPDILVDDELNRILIRLSSELEQQKKTLDDYLKDQATTLDALKAKWRPNAVFNVKTSLILDEIGKSEKVAVSREEVEKAMAGVNQTDLSAEQKADLEKYIVFSIFQVKTLDLVKKAVAVS